MKPHPDYKNVSNSCNATSHRKYACFFKVEGTIIEGSIEFVLNLLSRCAAGVQMNSDNYAVAGVYYYYCR